MKSVGLFSGGLDSALAVKLILDQGIDVVALNFTSPFYIGNSVEKRHASLVAKRFNFPLKIIDMGRDQLRFLRNPKFGYGSGFNPCIDCRIYMLKKAKAFADRIGARFIFTGEVLGERPMSQRLKALELIDRESGLEGKIVRPLSAKVLEETEAERMGWVDRSRLLGIKGRSRKPQIELAEKLGIEDYPSPSGGCLLTYKEFARKVKDLYDHKKHVSIGDIDLLKVGRHFRYRGNKIIVGKDRVENQRLLELKRQTDLFFEVDGCGSPITLLQGRKTKEAVEVAAALTARYSDASDDRVPVKYGRSGFDWRILVTPIPEADLRAMIL